MRLLGAFVAAALFLAGPASAGFLQSPAGFTIDVQTRPGVTERYLLWVPDGTPKAIALLLIGGDGLAGIRDKTGPTFAQRGNFLPRSREWFRRRGFAVAEVDAPSDHKDGLLFGFRLSAEHATDTAAVMADLRRRIPNKPLWLIGTSRGSISAASIAARLQGPQGPEGIVLTSSPTEQESGLQSKSRDSVMDADFSAIRVPTLVTFHRADSCPVVSVKAGDTMLRKLVNAPRKELLLFDGGDKPESGPCDPLAPHGYWGIEDQVVNAIADWILAPKS